MVRNVPLQDIASAHAALRRMTMAEVRTLAAVADNGSFSKAAIALGASQPLLSQHVRELEEKVGVRLFERHRRGVTPTDYGAALVRCARAIGDELSATAQALAATYVSEQPTVRVGCQATSAGLVARAAVRFAALETRCRVRIVEERRDLLLQGLRTARLDAFVGRLPESTPEAGLHREVLVREGVVVVCSAGDVLAGRARLTLAQVRDREWVLPAEGTLFRAQLAKSAQAAGFALPTARIECRSLLAVAAAVAAGRMLGFLPASIRAGVHVASLHTLPLAIPWLPEPIGVLVSRDVGSVGPARRFLECLRAEAGGG